MGTEDPLSAVKPGATNRRSMYTFLLGKHYDWKLLERQNKTILGYVNNPLNDRLLL